MAQKPFETLDLTNQYIKHDVPLYCHDHPSQPDGMNAAVKVIESELQAFDLDDYDLGGDPAEITDGSNTVTAAEARSHIDNQYLHGDPGMLNDGNYSVSAEQAWKLRNRSFWYGVRGTGSYLIAQCNLDTLGLQNVDELAIRLIVGIERLTADEQFFRREMSDGTDIYIIGKGVDDRLYFECNNGTTITRYNSLNTVFTASQINTPLEVGIQFDRVNDTIAFFYDGVCEATQATTTEFMDNTGVEWFVLGGGYQGTINELSVSGRSLHTPGTLYTPYPKGFDNIPACIHLYDFARDKGISTLNDRRNGIDLDVLGSWYLLSE